MLCVTVLQAGILQGDVDSLMVMDQWQASLMRALAQLQLKSDPSARSQVEQKFDLEAAENEEQEGELEE
jgi:molecular chaperone DnaK